MRRSLPAVVVAIVSCAWIFAGAAAPADAGTTPAVFLPNIRPLAPDQLSISTSRLHRKLRFAFSPEDIGTGPVELLPTREDLQQRRQRRERPDRVSERLR